jgi:hypothetical protein
MVLPPQLLQRRRLPTSGTARVSGKASTLTSAERPQFAHVAVTDRTTFLTHVGEGHWRAGLGAYVRRADC